MYAIFFYYAISLLLTFAIVLHLHVASAFFLCFLALSTLLSTLFSLIFSVLATMYMYVCVNI